jgi:insulysin
MSLQNDSWHFFNLLMNLAEDDSNLNRFMCGNKSTLQVDGMRDHLLSFHKKWYSSNIMHLVILSNSSIADLEKWATEKFSEIKNFDVEVPALGEPHPFPAGKLGKLIKFVPI